MSKISNKFPVLFHILSYYGYGDQAVGMMNSLMKCTKQKRFKNELVFAKDLKKRVILVSHRGQSQVLGNYKVIFYDLSIEMSSQFTLKDLHYMLNGVTDSYSELEKRVRAEKLMNNMSYTPLQKDTDMVISLIEMTEQIKLNIVKIKIQDDIQLNFSDLAVNFYKSAYKLVCLDRCKFEYNRNIKNQNIGSDLVQVNIVTAQNQIENQLIAKEDGHRNLSYIEQIDYLDVMLSNACSVYFFTKCETRIPVLKFKEVRVDLIDVGKLKTKDLAISDKVINEFLKNKSMIEHLETLIISSQNLKLAKRMLFEGLEYRFQNLFKLEFHKPDFSQLGSTLQLLSDRQFKVALGNMPRLETVDLNFYVLDHDGGLKANISRLRLKSCILIISSTENMNYECYRLSGPSTAIEVVGGQVVPRDDGLKAIGMNFVAQVKIPVQNHTQITPIHFDDNIEIPLEYDIDSIKIESAIKASAYHVQVFADHEDVEQGTLFAKTNTMLSDGLSTANSLRKTVGEDASISLALDIGKKSAKSFSLARYKDLVKKNIFNSLTLQPNTLSTVEFDNHKLCSLMASLCKANKSLTKIEIHPYLNQSYTSKLISGITNKKGQIFQNLNELVLNFEYFEESMNILQSLFDANGKNFLKLRLISQKLKLQETQTAANGKIYISKGIDLITEFVQNNIKLTHLHIQNCRGKRQLNFSTQCLTKYLMVVV